MFETLRSERVLKAEAFVAWLADERGIEVDRTLLSHWSVGRTHLPADLLPHLSTFTERPELVFAPYLREVGCDSVRVPEGLVRGETVVDHMLDVASSLGRLQDNLRRARAPDSPGGEAITKEEAAELRTHVDQLIQLLADFRSALDATAVDDNPQDGVGWKPAD